MSAVCEAVSVDELVALFVGDDDSAGYPCVALVKEICRRTQPTSALQLWMRMFGDWPPDGITHRSRCAVNYGYNDWRQFEKGKA